MNTIFEKIYVVSLITNRDRQEFVKKQLDNLNLEFEFIYAPDFSNFKNVQWPDINNFQIADDIKPNNFSCTLGHYEAVMQAYYLGYNNVLILEDDICFNKDASLIEDMLNNIPKDADFVTYDFRGVPPQEEEFKNIIKNNLDNKYAKLEYERFYGGMMYGIMNKQTLELYINNQHEKMIMNDWVDNFWINPSITRYIPTKCLCVSQVFYKKVFVQKSEKPIFLNDNVFYRVSENLTENDFYKPDIFHEYSRYNNDINMSNVKFICINQNSNKPS